MLLAIPVFLGLCACGGEAVPSIPEPVKAPWAAFAEGYVAATTPEGWIREYLDRQTSGLTGHPDALSYPYNTCLWAGEISRNSEEYGSNWWRYEQTAYYSDGLLRLGYLLGNEEFIAKGEDGVEYTLQHVDPDGRLGMHGFALDTDGREGKLQLWPQAVYFRVMQAYYDATGDARIPEALEKHYLNFNAEQTSAWRNIMNVEGILWTYARTGNPALLTLAEEAWKYGDFELNEAVCLSEKPLRIHGVTCCETIKIPMLLYAYTGNTRYLDVALAVEAKLEREALLPDGVPSSAEHLVGRVANRSHETCDITDYTWTLGHFLLTTGEACWADKIERAMFNAAPGAVTKDFRSLQYFSSPNQFIATGNSNNNVFFHGSTWMAYRPIHETECCSGNVHRAMPDYASRMWLTTGGDNLTAALFGPSEISRVISDGSTVSINEDTSYPFEDELRFRFRFSSRGRHSMSLGVRIPGWATSYTVLKNGSPVDWEDNGKGFAMIEGPFRSGDVVCVRLDGEVVRDSLDVQGVFFTRGPLLFSYPIPADMEVDDNIYSNMFGKTVDDPAFKCWSITPAAPWNYGFVGGETSAELIRTGAEGYPFDAGSQPVILRVQASSVPGWTLDEGRFTPENPAGTRAADDSTVTLDLVPYGSTLLRLTVFPSLLPPEGA